MSDEQPPPPPAYPPPPPPYPPPARPAPRPSRWPVFALAVICVLIVAAIAVAVPMLIEDEPVTLTSVRVYDDLSTAHTPADVNYPQTPPVGGPHANVWLDCGVYDEPVRDENAVHDLEHGTVWISYDPDLDADDVDRLADALPQNGIMAPYPDLDAPVVVTVWGRQLSLASADDPRLELFVREFGGGSTAPEPFASCAGGVADPEGRAGTDV